MQELKKCPCHWMKVHGSLQQCAEAKRLLSIIDNSSQQPVAEDATVRNDNHAP